MGIEEGGGGNIAHINQKFGQFYYWCNIIDGLVDNFEFQSLLDEVRVGGFLAINNPQGPARQTTWLPPMKALINHRGGYWPTLIEAKWSQVKNLGRQKITECLNSCWIELFPLPNPGVNNFSRWENWTAHFDVEWRMPANRRMYENFVLPNTGNNLINTRLQFLKDKIECNKPKNIIAYVGTESAYSHTIQNFIQGISPGPFNIIAVPPFAILQRDIDWGSNQVTRVLIVRHPARTNHNNYWQAVSNNMLP